MIRSVCVFCGSRVGQRPSYLAHARLLGETLASRGIRLVYGGASVGLMGALADAALAGKGEAVGVIPEALVAREIAHASLTQLHVVKTMHQRKAKMAELSDAFIALPGGLGTLEELFEIMTWGMLGIHRKPVGLLDTDGYYQGLLRFLDHAVTEGFVDRAHAAMLVVRDSPSSLLDALLESESKVPPVPKVMDPSER